jgi:hypothetical protein
MRYCLITKEGEVYAGTNLRCETHADHEFYVVDRSNGGTPITIMLPCEQLARVEVINPTK